MKRVVLILLIAALLTGCGASASDKNPKKYGVVTEAIPETTKEESTQVVNPLKEVSAEELLAETGIVFQTDTIALDPQYFVLTPADPTENKIAELRFPIGECELTYRIQPTNKEESYDMTGLYYDWDVVKDVKVGDCDAKYMKCKDASGMYWIDTNRGMNYSFICVGDMEESQFINCANTLYNPPNPEDPEELPAYDYEGFYLNENGDDVTVTRNEDGSYRIEIGIVRLCFLEGRANDMDGAAELVVTDPNGNQMSGIFFVNPDDTYTLTITESTWTYINTGDRFEGFVRQQ